MQTIRIALATATLLLFALGATDDGDPVNTWDWSLERANPWYCAMELNDHYDVNLQIARENVTIAICRGGKTLHSFIGHRASVFAVHDGLLFYVEYNFAGSGGTVTAVDLSNEKKLWSSKLQAVPIKTHSTYSNFINILPLRQGVKIQGSETGGDYIEVLDYKSGKQISHEIVNHIPKK